MAQHETCFADSVLQGSCILEWAGQLCIHRESNLNHPHCSVLGQPHCYHSNPSAAPVVSHLKPLARFTDFFGNCAGNLVCQWSNKPPWPLLAPLFWNGCIFQKFWANCEKMLLLDTIRQNLVGFAFGVLWVAAILRHVVFCLKNSLFWPQKTQKNADLAENLT